ncbi:hypothetical protein BASA50_004779 [Batrachochytrium salamandrivorans]|uniref:C2H2-type domain-containing protein n=1 Tax=Batrachochytrium salamandrivorans TaxID=1357716 RepID=A0ABQ8FEP7_9FUNG|nr:hypothetical protein BASA61_005187 [Batrachochytrium salamandrivorans]KAH6597021.1 hypothetical protein BASA50_004779 [Batrachochytrium salamandrivorans]
MDICELIDEQPVEALLSLSRSNISVEHRVSARHATDDSVASASYHDNHRSIGRTSSTGSATNCVVSADAPHTETKWSDMRLEGPSSKRAHYWPPDYQQQQQQQQQLLMHPSLPTQNNPLSPMLSPGPYLPPMMDHGRLMQKQLSGDCGGGSDTLLQQMQPPAQMQIHSPYAQQQQQHRHALAPMMMPALIYPSPAMTGTAPSPSPSGWSFSPHLLMPLSSLSPGSRPVSPFTLPTAAHAFRRPQLPHLLLPPSQAPLQSDVSGANVGSDMGRMISPRSCTVASHSSEISCASNAPIGRYVESCSIDTDDAMADQSNSSNGSDSSNSSSRSSDSSNSSRGSNSNNGSNSCPSSSSSWSCTSTISALQPRTLAPISSESQPCVEQHQCIHQVWLPAHLQQRPRQELQFSNSQSYEQDGVQGSTRGSVPGSVQGSESKTLDRANSSGGYYSSSRCFDSTAAGGTGAAIIAAATEAASAAASSTATTIAATLSCPTPTTAASSSLCVQSAISTNRFEASDTLAAPVLLHAASECKQHQILQLQQVDSEITRGTTVATTVTSGSGLASCREDSHSCFLGDTLALSTLAALASVSAAAETTTITTGTSTTPATIATTPATATCTTPATATCTTTATVADFSLPRLQTHPILSNVPAAASLGQRPQSQCSSPSDSGGSYSPNVTLHQATYSSSSPVSSTPPSPLPKAKHFFMCSFPNCSLGFTRRQNLRSHMTVHTNERPHPCVQCPATFRRRQELLRHCRSVHAPAGIKLFRCSHCLRLFGRADALKRHIIANGGKPGNHGMTPWACAQTTKSYGSGSDSHSSTLESLNPLALTHDPIKTTPTILSPRDILNI